MSSNYMKPALISGVVFGTASSIPIVNCLNIFCCALAIGGGILAAYLYFNQAGAEAQPYGSGAVVGVLTGAIGAVVSAIVALPFRLIGMGGIDLSQIQDQLPDDVEIPPFLEQAIEAGGGAGFALGAMLIGFFVSLVLYCLFATVGGLIGAALFGNR